MSIPESPPGGAAAAAPGSADGALVRPAWQAVLEQFARDYLKDRRSERR